MSRTHTSEAEGAGLFCAVLERRPGTEWAWGWGSHRILISAHRLSLAGMGFFVRVTIREKQSRWALRPFAFPKSEIL